MTVVASFLTFPCISWWAKIAEADKVIFDTAEHFQKMTGRNRYDISGANNSIKLSIPLVNGRNQHIPMKDVLIFNDADWQTQHWRTLVSVYKRTPYFDHYENSLEQLFDTPFTHLIDFNRAAIHWVKAQLKINFKEEERDVYVKEYMDGEADLRTFKNGNIACPKYYQVFEDRIGFLPDLCILDLLFSEGPRAVDLLRS
jgi:hypothetical protein